MNNTNLAMKMRDAICASHTLKGDELDALCLKTAAREHLLDICDKYKYVLQRKYQLGVVMQVQGMLLANNPGWGTPSKRATRRLVVAICYAWRNDLGIQEWCDRRAR